MSVRYEKDRSVTRGCAPSQKLDANTRNLQNIENRHAESVRKKTCIQVLSLLDATFCQKRMYMQDVLCSVTGARYVIKVLILWF